MIKFIFLYIINIFFGHSDGSIVQIRVYSWINLRTEDVMYLDIPSISCREIAEEIGKKFPQWDSAVIEYSYGRRTRKLGILRPSGIYIGNSLRFNSQKSKIFAFNSQNEDGISPFGLLKDHMGIYSPLELEKIFADFHACHVDRSGQIVNGVYLSWLDIPVRTFTVSDFINEKMIRNDPDELYIE